MSKTQNNAERCSHLPPRVRSLIEAVEQHDHLTPTLARRLLVASGITAEDLSSWSDFDHPAADSYGRKLVHDGGFFELMVMSWVDGDMAAIHDHGYTQWGAVMLLGPAEHAIFKVEDGVMYTCERKVFEAGDVVAVGHDLIHQMGNVGQEPYLTLHLYGCYERQGEVTADARLYALDEGAVQITSGGVFFGLPEECVSRREQSPEADFPTLLRTKVELLRRRITQYGSLQAGALQHDDERRLAQELFSPELWEEARSELNRKADEAPTPRFERYVGILHQELRASARLQHLLLEGGLVSEAPFTAEELTPILECDNCETASARYLDLLGQAFELDLELSLAA